MSRRHWTAAAVGRIRKVALELPGSGGLPDHLGLTAGEINPISTVLCTCLSGLALVTVDRPSFVQAAPLELPGAVGGRAIQARRHSSASTTSAASSRFPGVHVAA